MLLLVNNLASDPSTHDVKLLHRMTDEWLTRLARSAPVGILFVAFCKASDVVDINTLHKNLRFSDNAMAWFRSYMYNSKNI